MRDTWTDPVVEQEVAEATAKRNAEIDSFVTLCEAAADHPIREDWRMALWQTSVVIANRLDESEQFWQGWIVGRLAAGETPAAVIRAGMARVEAREPIVRPR